MNELVKTGLLVHVANHRYYLPNQLKDVAKIVKRMTATAPLTVKAFRDKTGIGRNVAIEVLEYFDSKGFTRRQGNDRIILNPTMFRLKKRYRCTTGGERASDEQARYQQSELRKMWRSPSGTVCKAVNASIQSTLDGTSLYLNARSNAKAKFRSGLNLHRVQCTSRANIKSGHSTPCCCFTTLKYWVLPRVSQRSVLAVSLVIDAVSDPLAGAFSDSFRSRLATPWLNAVVHRTYLFLCMRCLRHRKT